MTIGRVLTSFHTSSHDDVGGILRLGRALEGITVWKGVAPSANRHFSCTAYCSRHSGCGVQESHTLCAPIRSVIIVAMSHFSERPFIFGRRKREASKK